LPEAPREIIELVDKFERNLEAYKNPSYKEEQLKQEFINPFFKALGWDVDNTLGAAPQYRDVIFEDSIKVAGGTKAPDYCFTLSGRKMFFLEAKKPSVNIDKDIKPAYQLRRYAWSAKLPLSILTDFDEFAVYDSRSRPKKTDRASVGRIKYISYKDYVTEWDYLYNTFSKEAVIQGAYDKYAEDTKKKRGTTEVDDEFLSEIEKWRELLAKEIALRNPDLTVDELNYSVQQIIDRIIFLRMGEDRGAEKYGQLQKLLDKNDIYQHLCYIWENADEKYNSGLFHFKEEKDQTSPPDTLTPTLNIKDGVFKQIIKNIYYPDSPYEFSVLSPEILGNVYEQFLGKVIRLTPGHRAKIEEKPEVKKAGGVYYTPQYIVEYIVKNTVGKLCKDKTPKKVSKLRILDPACGSGSFLLGAYNYLLQWHLDYYINLKDKKRLKNEIYKGKNNEWHLTIKEKKRILLNNIYGVDIDSQAVNVTKLSLLLKVLEGENKDVLEAQQKLFKERALPDLGKNIKCGNTLIGPDIYDSDLKLTTDDIKRINTFDWGCEYAEVMNKGGFDAVIGNPPYIRIQAMKEWAPIEVELYKQKYRSASKGNYDIYVVFVEKALNLLNKKGLLGFILPHKFFNAKYGEPLRDLIANAQNLEKIIHFGDQQVFEKVSTYTCLLFLGKKANNKFEFFKVKDLNEWIHSPQESILNKIKFNFKNSEEWNIIYGPEAEIFYNLKSLNITLGDLTRIFQGLTTGANDVFILKSLSENDAMIKVKTNNGDEFELEKAILKPLIKNVSLSSYEIPKPEHCIIFPYKIEKNRGKLIDIKEIKTNFPKNYEYLINNKDRLLNKSNTSSKDWWGYSYPKNLSSHDHKKLIVQVLSKEGRYAYDNKGVYFTGGGGGPYYGIVLKNSEIEYSIHYLQGILNSKLADFYLHKVSTTFRGGYWQYGKSHIEKIPIKEINFSNTEDIKMHDRMVFLVEVMLKLHKDKNTSRTPGDKELIERQIEATSKQIDSLVYELYGLTDKEIKILEGKI